MGDGTEVVSGTRGTVAGVADMFGSPNAEAGTASGTAARATARATAIYLSMF
jgi:hypothetical protein